MLLTHRTGLTIEKENNTVFSNIVTYLHTLFFEFLSLKHNLGIIIRTEYIGNIINDNNNKIDA